MKNPTKFVVAGCVVGLVLLFVFRSEERPWVPPVTMIKPVPTIGAPMPMKNAVATSMPPASSAASSSELSVTERRNRIWDAPDILAAVMWAAANGTPDDKAAAIDPFRECWALSAPRPDYVAGKERVEAWEVLARRCEGLKRLSWNERREMVAKLRAGAAQSTSPIGIVRMLAARPDARWSEPEARTLTEALHSRDATARNEAFGVLFSAIDAQAPGGAERRAALATAFGPEPYPTLPSSEFERTMACALLPNCGVPTAAEKEAAEKEAIEQTSAPMPDLERLRAAYAKALSKHAPVGELLSIH